MKKITIITFITTLACIAASAVIATAYNSNQQPEDYQTIEPSWKIDSTPLFTTAICQTPSAIAIAHKADKSVNLISLDYKTKIHKWNFNSIPTGVTANDKFILVTTKNNNLYKIDLSSNKIVDTLQLKSGSTYPVIVGGNVFVLEQFNNTVAKADIQNLELIDRTTVAREPKVAVASKDGKHLFVANFLPAGQANLDFVSADISVIDTESMAEVKRIPTANGSNALRGITITNDGKYVLVSHNLGRYTVPTSQLQQGWMNTSAMSVINASTLEYVGAVILDEPDKGAAGVWDIKCTDNKIFISHSSTHDLSVIDYPKFIDKLENYPGNVETLAYDLRFLYGIRERVKLAGNGPREMILAQNQIVIPTYFSDTINIVNLDDNAITLLPLVKNRVETKAQQGEKIFNDASYCFQNWQSCNGCHPGEARTDAMNWDLLNDGIGNSKNCKSLLYSIQTPPSMISGIRANAVVANRAGFTHIQFFTIPEEKALTIDAYISSLNAEPSPYLVNGQLSEKAKLGEKVFNDLKCNDCHSGPYYTDLKRYRIGEDIEFEAGWDTPTLREVWRTGPYLFDGRADNMYDVFATHKHGIKSKISKKNLQALTEYVLSL